LTAAGDGRRPSSIIGSHCLPSLPAIVGNRPPIITDSYRHLDNGRGWNPDLTSIVPSPVYRGQIII